MEGFLPHASKSHRKITTTPEKSVKLAELLGIVFGDGGINNPWQVVVTLSAFKDDGYSRYVAAAFEQLFAIKVVIRSHPKENVLRVVCSSMNIVDFLVGIGAVRGNKIRQQIAMPTWMLEDLEYQKWFVRGLVDTDGCLFVHNHKVANKMRYNIGFCFTSYSTKLLDDVSRIFLSFGIKPHITDSGRRIYLYSAKSVKKYLEIFGTSNERISNVYESWLMQKEDIGEFA